MVELTKKRSGLTLPTPNVEDAGMLMGMGKRSHYNIEIFMFRLHTGRLELRSSYWMVDKAGEVRSEIEIFEYIICTALMI